MIPPKARVPIAAILSAIGVAIPLTLVGVNLGKTQQSVDAANQVSEALTRIAKDDIVNACYISTVPLKKGAEFNPGEQPSSVCAKDKNGRVAFLEIQEGRVMITEVFTPTQLQNARSQVLTKKKKNN
jgi:hypothetical protein